MDESLPPADIRAIEVVLGEYEAQGVQYHALRTRRAGPRRFVSFHVQVPGDWTVQKGHDLVEEIEARLAQQFSPVALLVHLEPIEDPLSWKDEGLDRW